MSNLQIGTQVKMVYGFGRTESGKVVDIRTNRWGQMAVISLDNGDEEYVDTISMIEGLSAEIGCHIL